VWLDNGHLSPKSLHLTNIILHAVVSCQLLHVYNLLFNGRAPKTSFLAALMFAVHPIHVEVVCTRFILVYFKYNNKSNYLCIDLFIFRCLVLSVVLIYLVHACHFLSLLFIIKQQKLNK